jgi:DNA-binding NtrC family response regulator
MSSWPVLVVDDDPLAAEYLVLALRERFAEVFMATGGEQALEVIRSAHPRVVVSDLRMPNLDGLALMAESQKWWPEIPFIIVSVDGDVGTVVEALRKGAADYLVKPIPPSRLQESVLRTVGQDRYLETETPEILGRDSAMVRVRRRILEAARSELNVLINGETGTGKELVARAIHRASSRSSGPFVAQNCAAIPRDLFESHFFGHRRGAFSGAERDHRGVLEEAEGGVLFLDELECLAPSHQAKLLRVMDDGCLRRVGSEECTRVSVRFLAATNREPSRLLEEGSLREDLYYRIRELKLALPPLRDRRDDIPLLADHFLRGITLAPCAVQALKVHSWPGNVRELKSLLGASLHRARHGQLTARSLDFQAASSESPQAGTNPICGFSLRDTENAAIRRALQAASGSIAKAARLLGIHRSTLWRKMRDYGISAST